MFAFPQSCVSSVVIVIVVVLIELDIHENHVILGMPSLFHDTPGPLSPSIHGAMYML
jgi:hypothetical protein